MSPAPACPVCLAAAARAFLTIQGRDYWRCTECGATFLEPTQRPDAAAERAHYDSHRNEIDDPGYRRFLARLTVPLLERLAPGSRVLDYGCGPGPALAAMLTEAGHDVCLYDPFYRPDTAVLEGPYDAITCTEVVEHFHEPMQELVRLRALLRPGGLLGDHDLLSDRRFALRRLALPPRPDPCGVLQGGHAPPPGGTARARHRRAGEGRGDPAQANRLVTTDLHEARFAAVLDVVLASGARTVLDLGCGDGALLLRLAELPGIERLVGIDQSPTALAALRRKLEAVPAPVAAKVSLREGSYARPDPRLRGFDAAIMVETIEHIDPERLSAVEHAVFAALAPALVVVTTPNADFNPLLGVPDHRMRHPDHRFEWGRARFGAWANGVARRHGYRAALHDLGGSHPVLGGPSQMAVLRRPATPSSPI